MTPRQHHVVKPTVRLVDPVFGGVDGIVEVGVALERFGVDVLVGELAAHDKGVLEYSSEIELE